MFRAWIIKLKTHRKKGRSTSLGCASVRSCSSKPTTLLPPTPLNQHPAIASSFPPMGFPSSVRMWRQLPTASHPNVPVPIPIVITGDPDVVPARTCAPMLHNSGRRSHPNNHFRSKCGHSSHSGADQQCRKRLFEFHFRKVSLMWMEPNRRIPSTTDTKSNSAANHAIAFGIMRAITG